MNRCTWVIGLVAVLLLVASTAGSANERPGIHPEPGEERGWWARSWEYVPVDSNMGQVQELVRRELANRKSTIGEAWHLTALGHGMLFMVEGRTSKPYPGELETAAQQFLNENWALITGRESRSESPALNFEPVKTGPSRVRFSAYSEGIQVWGVGLAVDFDSESHIVGMTFSPLLHACIPEFPAPRPFEDIVAQLHALIRPDSSRVKGEHQLVVYPSNPPRLAYSCALNVWRLAFGIPVTPSFVVDAVTGEVLYVMSNIVID